MASARARVDWMLTAARAPLTLALTHILGGWCDLEEGDAAAARERLEIGRFLAGTALDGRLGGMLALSRAELCIATGRTARGAVRGGERTASRGSHG